MSEQGKRTPTPWRLSDTGRTIHGTGRNFQVCTIPAGGVRLSGVDIANGKFIVRACNSHDELLEACKAALKQHRLERRQIFGTDALEEQLRAAISKAEAGHAERVLAETEPKP